MQNNLYPAVLNGTSKTGWSLNVIARIKTVLGYEPEWLDHLVTETTSDSEAFVAYPYPHLAQGTLFTDLATLRLHGYRAVSTAPNFDGEAYYDQHAFRVKIIEPSRQQVVANWKLNSEILDLIETGVHYVESDIFWSVEEFMAFDTPEIVADLLGESEMTPELEAFLSNMADVIHSRLTTE